MCDVAVEWLEPGDLIDKNGLVARGAIRSYVGAEVDPSRLTAHLLCAGLDAGVTVHDRTEVTEIEERDASVVPETARGPTVTARRFEDRLLFGRRDVPLRDARARDRLIPSTARALCDDLRALASGRDVEPAFAWARTLGVTGDGLGYLGAMPGRPRTLHALGFGGNGIATSVTAARLATEGVCGRGGGDLRLIRFGRQGAMFENCESRA